MLATRLGTSRDLPECIVPIPLSNGRIRGRGFNQSMEIARPVSRKLGIPLKPGLLERIRNTPPQSKLDIRERRRNIRNAFRFNGKASPGHVAIIDDVVTTGSTVNEAARILRLAGAKRIEVWSVARALR